jgi:hypothetical protein
MTVMQQCLQTGTADTTHACRFMQLCVQFDIISHGSLSNDIWNMLADTAD